MSDRFGTKGAGKERKTTYPLSLHVVRVGERLEFKRDFDPPLRAHKVGRADSPPPQGGPQPIGM